MPDDVKLTARLDALEVRIADQDQTSEELNAALTGQWQEIDRLRREMARLESELRQAAESIGEAGAPEPPPPNY